MYRDKAFQMRMVLVHVQREKRELLAQQLEVVTLMTLIAHTLLKEMDNEHILH